LFAVLGRPRIVDLLEHCQCHYHVIILTNLPP
jgi:hypothetical protein